VAELRVLYDATLAGNPAGTGTYTRGLLEALRQRSDLKLSISSLAASSVETLDTARKGRGARAGNSLRHLAYYANTLPRRARQTRADVIFCPSALVPLRGRTPLVMTVYDLTVRRYPQTLDPLSRMYAGFMLATGLRRSRMVCTISQAIGDEIKASRPGARVQVAYPGPNPELRAASAEPLPDLKPPFLLMVGTLEPRKNHITVLRAFSGYRERHPDTKLSLVLAGSPGWRYAEVLAAIDDLGLSPHVIRLGSKSPGGLKWLYRNARALLFPSLYEGFGLPVLEAFLLNCPVVAARIPPVIEIAQTNTAELLEPLEVDAWMRAIEELDSSSSDPARLAAAAERGREFTWERCAESVAMALRSAIENR
jgi:glycosyltransferase involved in cell wall biosynthesis